MKSKSKNKGKIITILSILIITIFLIFILKKSNNSDEKLDKNTQFELIYTQNEKNELIKIIDKNYSKDYDFDVYTYGGDVLININGKSYDFKEALLQNIISIDNILEKAKDDAQNDICTEAKYLDGGSTEYWYSDYTILKYNKEYIGKNNRKDFVIGMKKEIINKVDEILEKDERLDDTATLSEDSGWLNNQ